MITNRSERRAKITAILLSILPLSTIGYADLEFTPVYHPALNAPRAQDEIEIDGNLDDSGWRGAGCADNFAEHFPGDQTRPPVETRAYITYDEKNIYVAFVCHDDPALIRASLSDRDVLYSDDNIGFFFDTYGDAEWAYILNVNPYGIQADALWSRTGGEDNRFDLVWESAGHVTDSGWQVEMAIPFSSLRFPHKAEQVWKVDFWRNHPRDSRRQYSWAAYDRDDPCWPCKWGTVAGIENVSPGRGVELLPSFVSFQSGSLQTSTIVDPATSDTTFRQELDDEDLKGELSLGARYAILSNLVAEATYNPDFSQVEADAAQIDVNTAVALDYPERRPFFQEGNALFQSYIYGFYSRNINDPVIAAKFTGRFARTSLALLSGYDEHSPVTLPFEEFSLTIPDIGKTYSTVARARYAFGDESHVGFVATDRRRDGGGSGSLLSFDTGVRFLQNWRLQFQCAVSHTREPNDSSLTTNPDDSLHRERFDRDRHTIGFDGESLRGHGFYAELEREARHWQFDLSYRDYSPSFRTDVGLETKNNRREVAFHTNYTFYLTSGIVDRISTVLIMGRVWNYNKAKKDEWIIGELSARLKRQTFVSVSYLKSWEQYRGKNFPDITRYTVHLDSDFSEAFGGGARLTWGHIIARGPAVMGNEVVLSSWVYFKPLDRLRIEPTFDYDKSDDPATGENIFEGYIARVRTQFQFTRELFVRLVVQYNDFWERWDVDPLLTYRLNPFSLFYIGSTYDYNYLYSYSDQRDRWMLSQRQYFVKLQYLFQL